MADLLPDCDMTDQVVEPGNPMLPNVLVSPNMMLMDTGDDDDQPQTPAEQPLPSAPLDDLPPPTAGPLVPPSPVGGASTPSDLPRLPAPTISTVAPPPKCPGGVVQGQSDTEAVKRHLFDSPLLGGSSSCSSKPMAIVKPRKESASSSGKKKLFLRIPPFN